MFRRVGRRASRGVRAAVRGGWATLDGGAHLFITRWAVFLLVADSQWQVVERRNGGHELMCLTTRHQAAVVLSIRFRSTASVNVIEVETDLRGGLRLEFHRCR